MIVKKINLSNPFFLQVISIYDYKPVQYIMAGTGVYTSWSGYLEWNHVTDLNIREKWQTPLRPHIMCDVSKVKGRGPGINRSQSKIVGNIQLSMLLSQHEYHFWKYMDIRIIIKLNFWHGGSYLICALCIHLSWF